MYGMYHNILFSLFIMQFYLPSIQSAGLLVVGNFTFSRSRKTGQRDGAGGGMGQLTSSFSSLKLTDAVVSVSLVNITLVETM